MKYERWQWMCNSFESYVIYPTHARSKDYKLG